jgi:SAM-dependent methyltransferase
VLRFAFIGGFPGYLLLRRLGRDAAQEKGYCSGAVYRDESKLEALFGPHIWDEVSVLSVLDFGCGVGQEAIEIAKRGARRVVGIDIRQKVLDRAVRDARSAGVADTCVFAMHTDEQFDVIVSIDGFEHYEDPAGVLCLMRERLYPGGKLIIAFGPPWLHPMGGHLFSVFPWAHLIFTESALIRWRADFKTDGARRFHEVEGGLNQMTIRRFRRLIGESDFDVESLELVPMKRLKRLFNPLTREFLTSVVRCTLVPADRATRNL